MKRGFFFEGAGAVAVTPPSTAVNAMTGAAGICESTLVGGVSDVSSIPETVVPTRTLSATKPMAAVAAFSPFPESPGMLDIGLPLAR